MSVAFSPDGKYLATGSEDNTAKIWDLQTGKSTLALEGHRNSVFSDAFSPDGKLLATGSADETDKIWDLQTGKSTLALEGHRNSVWASLFPTTANSSLRALRTIPLKFGTSNR
ncbi:MAG: hypothetical protein IPJ82_23790 [Lewinellaceae bacterium]|nr:hypothetical protein [Lewinellaceae bacterium]